VNSKAGNEDGKYEFNRVSNWNWADDEVSYLN